MMQPPHDPPKEPDTKEMKYVPDVAIFGFDGTLVVNPIVGREDMDAFVGESATFQPHPSTVSYFQDYAEMGIPIFVVTTRPERYRELTNRRIRSLVGNEANYHLIMMDDDMVIEPEEFHRLISNILLTSFGILEWSNIECVVFDDDKRNLACYYDSGAYCLVVDPTGNFYDYEMLRGEYA